MSPGYPDANMMRFANARVMLERAGKMVPPRDPPKVHQSGDRPKPLDEDAKGGSTVFGDELLARSHSAIDEAERLAWAGDRDEARALLGRTADELREGAPGSGRPHEVMQAVHSLRELIEKL
jgi:hypothetical protein